MSRASSQTSKRTIHYHTLVPHIQKDVNQCKNMGNGGNFASSDSNTLISLGKPFLPRLSSISNTPSNASSNASSIIRTASENPPKYRVTGQLSLREGTFKFHVLLEDGGRRFETTLGHEPLQFIIIGQKVLAADGTEFRHPPKNEIWKMVVKCESRGWRHDHGKGTIQR
jgi:hypothetical protein